MSTAASPKKSTNVRSTLTRALLRTSLSAVEAISSDAAAGWALRWFLTPRRRPAGHPGEVFAQAAPFTLHADGRALTAWSWGSGDQTVLLVHGWEGRASQLAALVPPLVRAGRRVIAFDAPAHGDSPGRQATIHDFALAITAAEAAAGGLSGLVAHSFGAPAAALAMTRGLAIESAVFVAPMITPERVIRWYSDLVGLSPSADASFRQRLAARNDGATSDDLDVLRNAPTMSAELLVVHDREDREVAFEAGHALASRWPGAALLPTEGLGHVRILRDPRVVDAITSFIAGAAPSEAEVIERELFDRDARMLSR